MSGRAVGFALALSLQVALLAAVPWEREKDESTTQTIWLKARAGGDRHDVMRGDYVNLTYDISDPAQFAEIRELRSSETVYAVLQEMEPGVWSGLRIEAELPSHLPAGQVAIKGTGSNRNLQINTYLRQEADGTWAADSIVAGEMHRSLDLEQKDRALAAAWVRRQAIAYRDIDSYFVPESERRGFDEDLLAHPEEVIAQVRVSEDGGATLLQVRIQDRVYEF